MDERVVGLIREFDGNDDPQEVKRRLEQLVAEPLEPEDLAYCTIIRGLYAARYEEPRDAENFLGMAVGAAAGSGPRLRMLTLYYYCVNELIVRLPADRAKGLAVSSEVLHGIAGRLINVYIACRDLGSDHDERGGIAMSLAAECELLAGKYVRALDCVNDSVAKLRDCTGPLATERTQFNRLLIAGDPCPPTDFSRFLYQPGELLDD